MIYRKNSPPIRAHAAMQGSLRQCECSASTISADHLRGALDGPAAWAMHGWRCMHAQMKRIGRTHQPSSSSLSSSSKTASFFFASRNFFIKIWRTAKQEGFRRVVMDGGSLEWECAALLFAMTGTEKTKSKTPTRMPIAEV
jgi:hypothetical protein